MKIRTKASGEWRVASDVRLGGSFASRPSSPVTRHPSRVTGFTMVEIAICLAIIGFALIAIIGVLPIGMNTQRDNREETVINQDATIFIEAIRNGARGLDDLTNYVYAITNFWTEYDNKGAVLAGGGSINNGYNNDNFAIAPSYYTSSGSPINSGANIVGLLNTPEYTDANGAPIPALLFGGYSNHIVAYVRSISGPAVEKPPQDNQIIRADAFGYHILCVNAPMAVDTNLFYLHPLWQPQVYGAGQPVFYNWVYWQATAPTLATDIPGQSFKWAKTRIYGLELISNLHELRLTFLWPHLPNGGVGPGRQTFRMMVAGQLVTNIVAGQILYFYQSQSFNSAP